MNEKLRINFVMPPIGTISGGPLAILEYANRFIDRGHKVTVTTYPDTTWSGDSPFPWFKFQGPIIYKRMRHNRIGNPSVSPELLRLLGQKDMKALSETILGNFGLHGLRDLILDSVSDMPERMPFQGIFNDMLQWLHTMEVMPDCDLNIATFWSTAFPVFFSNKGKPVYFMQHYEEIFYPLQPNLLLYKLNARMSYELPMFKVANSSWLQKQIKQRFGQDIPFSNNGLELSDFWPQPKRSEKDGVLRVFTYSRPEEWKGFGDALAAIAKIRERYRDRVEWHVFGYSHPTLTPDNSYAPYTYHPKLPFRDLAKLYATSDIALCPSWYESFPLPPLEAMASGTAVVTTDLGTEDYAFHEKNALVVGSRQIDAMVDSIARLIEDEPLRKQIAKAGRETAETLTWDVAVEKREKILQAIHQGNPGYDVLKSAKANLLDAHGLEFEAAPCDLPSFEPGLFWYRGALYLHHKGTKRHVVDSSLIPKLLHRKFRYIEVDNLSIERIPDGLPVSGPSDLSTLCSN